MREDGFAFFKLHKLCRLGTPNIFVKCLWNVGTDFYVCECKISKDVRIKSSENLHFLIKHRFKPVSPILALAEDLNHFDDARSTSQR